MNKTLTVTLSCALCSADHVQEIPMPEGWDSNYASVSDERAFCPQHSDIHPFTESQCPGCVGSWGDCGLHQSFAYSRLELSDADFQQLNRGICPKRVNGTFMVSRSDSGVTIEDADLRDPPAVEAGKQLAKAIREYALTYHKREGSTKF